MIEEYELGLVRTHDLDRLLKIIAPFIPLDPDPALTELLSRLYIDARYPGDMGLLPEGKPTLTQARDFEAFARKVYHTVKEALSQPEPEHGGPGR